MLRAQGRELPTHLNKIESFAVWLPFQMKLAREPCKQTRPRAEYIGATASPLGTRIKGNVRHEEASVT